MLSARIVLAVEKVCPGLLIGDGVGVTSLQSLIDRVNEAWGRQFALLYRFGFGAEGVYAVEENGCRYALRYWPCDGSATGVFDEIHRRLQVLRERGVPIPAVTDAGYVGTDYVEVSAFVDGTPPIQDSDDLVDQALSILALLRLGPVDAENTWGSWLLSSITDDAINFTRPAALREVGGECAELLSAAQALMARYQPNDLSTDAVVHADFHVGNLLMHNKKVVAVVDWSGCRDGSGCFDLTGLYWSLTLGSRSAAVCWPQVADALAGCPEADRATSAAHYAVRETVGAVQRGNIDGVLPFAWQQLRSFD